MSNDFSDFVWHDANLLGIIIDRTNPGNTDTIEMIVEWLDGNISKVLFCDCFAMQSEMRFGVVASESIRSFYCESEGNEISAIKAAHVRAGQRISTLKCYTLETNSTASIIKIYALSMEINSVSSHFLIE